MKKEQKDFQIKFQRHTLENNEISKLKLEESIKTLKEELKLELPNKQMEEDIEELEDLIKRKKAKMNDNTEEEAKESDLLMMKIIVKSYKRQLKLGIPMRQKTWELKNKELSQDKNANGSYDNVIKDTLKVIKQLERNVVVESSSPQMVG